jgi:hypothetical protein
MERVQQAVAYADEEQQDQKGDAERIEGDEELASPFETNGDSEEHRDRRNRVEDDE